MQQRVAPLYKAGTQMGLAPTAAGLALLASGWSDPEGEDFVWSDGPEAELRFAMAVPTRDMLCRIEVMPFVATGALLRQRIEVFFNFFRVGYAELAAGRQTVAFEVPRELFMLRTHRVVFHLPDCASPLALGVGDDGRRLGIALSGFQIAAAS
jgi:hypothetical protein